MNEKNQNQIEWEIWAKKTETRLRQLEERIAFYEHGADSISTAEYELEKRLQFLELQNRQLIAEVRRLRENQRDPFNPQLEKPPHY
ncbi:MAG: SlyX family protein [Planctomycetia bacterium]|nr:SlyX family protein [Planctomycetia bacterium]